MITAISFTPYDRKRRKAFWAVSVKQLKPSCKMQLGFYRCSHYIARRYVVRPWYAQKNGIEQTRHPNRLSRY